MAWHVRVGGSWRNTDDLTLNEIEQVEKATGEPWGLLNPLRSMPVAKALLACFAIRDGATDDDATAQVGKLTLKTTKHAFRWVDDDDLPAEWEDGLPVVDPKAATPGTST